MSKVVKDSVYIDSCCFIDLVKYNLKKNDPNWDGERIKDIEFCKLLCDAAYDGQILIITSSITIAECLHAGEEHVDDEVMAQFNKFLVSGRVAQIYSADYFVSIKARDLRWKHGINVRGADGIHLASALLQECKEFITTDEKIKTRDVFSKAIPQIQKIGLPIIHASETKCIPTDYLHRYQQANMLDDLEKQKK